MPVLNPDHLLEQADRLMASTGRGAPRQADLRRAISNAYYGVFHAVVTEAADHFVGRTQRQTPTYGLVYRSIDPSSCNWPYGVGPIQKRTPRTEEDISIIARFSAEIDFSAHAALSLPKNAST